MSWDVTVTLDKDKTNVGNVSAVFTDPGDSAEFVYNARSAVSAADRDVFIANAIAGRNAWQDRRTLEAGYNVNVENRFVELDV